MPGKIIPMPDKTAAKGVQRCMSADCGSEFALSERIYVCPQCGGPLEIVNASATKDGASLRRLWEVRAGSRDVRDLSGVWRYRELLPFDDHAPFVTLFEGNTPLYEAARCAGYCGLLGLRLKHQGCNPTGSFKDTGMTAAVTQAVIMDARTVVCASTGNTAASMSAYAARAGLQAAILLPHGQITASKLAQSMDYGAVICEIDGNFDDCMRLITELGDDPSIYVANSINPFRIEGQKTVAFELMQQCGWQVPDHVVVPGGNMGNSSALGKGFSELLELRLINRLPRLHVIQAEGSAPLASMFGKMFGSLEANALATATFPSDLLAVTNPRTLATAIKIGSPVSWQKSLRAVLNSGGKILAVTEQEIADAKAMIGRDGIGCEPASATTVAGIKNLVDAGEIRSEDSVVAVLTGHVLKDPDYVSRYHRGELALETAEGPRPIRGTYANVPERVASTKSAILASLERHKSHASGQ